MNHSQVLEHTTKYMKRHMIQTIVGEYDADMYWAYATSQEDQDNKAAIALNSRADRILSINDRRTRGYKYLMKQRKDFYGRYEKAHVRPPSKLNGLEWLLK